MAREHGVTLRKRVVKLMLHVWASCQPATGTVIGARPMVEIGFTLTGDAFHSKLMSMPIANNHC